jgi:hypothetical protein
LALKDKTCEENFRCFRNVGVGGGETPEKSRSEEFWGPEAGAHPERKNMDYVKNMDYIKNMEHIG